MAMNTQYNLRSPAVKRLMKEALEMREPTEDCSASPLDDNLFEWHFTIRGAIDTEFEGGIYHGRITFPSEYPMKPPHILLFTPNGRFETDKKICLSISGHHPETWLPSWCVRTALMALIAFMPTPAGGTVGSLEYSREERQALARKSQSWKCSSCGNICDLLLLKGKPNLCTVKGESENRSQDTAFSLTQVEVPDNHVMTDEIDLMESDPIITTEPTEPISEVSHTSASPGPIPSLHHCNLFTNILSNVSNSAVTIGIIMLLIAFLLYRRLYLLN